MGYVLPPFGLFSVPIATSLGRNARITPLLADDMPSKIVSKSSKANLKNPPYNFFSKSGRRRLVRSMA